MHHVAVTYDGASDANDPVLYVDGVSQTLTQLSNPAGTLVDDSGPNLLAGETGGGLLDLDGAEQNVGYASGIWTAAQVNLHRWHGRIGGPVAVLHPMYTTKTANEGTATADISATGTTVISRIPRCSRPGCGVF
jgi:hypothetical protein